VAQGLNPADKGYAAVEVFAGPWVHDLIKWLAIEGDAACVVGELAGGASKIDGDDDGVDCQRIQCWRVK
jgi:hypothetical protein